ncbi:MAG: hypothetical protein NVS4B7_19250 [Ktedonobacteraceae bacterium]
MIKAFTQQQKNRNVEHDIDLLSTAPELQRVVPSNPHNILMLVQQHITIMIGPVIEPVTALELLTQICQQLHYVGQRIYKLVIQEYTKAVEYYPDNPYIHFSLGTLEHQSGNYNKAINAFTQAISESAIEVIARYNIAHCLLCQGYPDLAIQQLLHALRTARSASNEASANSVWAARPRKESEEDDTPEREIFKLLEKADKRIQRLAQKQPILQLKQTSPAHSNIVMPEEIPTSPSSEAPSSSQEKLASTQDTATSHREKLLEIEENSDTDSSIQIYDDEIHRSHTDGQTEHTLNELNELVRLAPDDPGLHNELANTYLQHNLLDSAITELRVLTCIYLSSKQLRDAGATVQRISQIYAEVGDIEEALTNLRYALELVPDNVDILCQIIDFCQLAGMKKEAAHYHVALANHYFNHHQLSEAATALQQLLTFDAKNYEAYDLLAQTYQLQGDFEQAIEVYRHLARLHIDSSIAWNNKAALQELRMMKTG